MNSPFKQDISGQETSVVKQKKNNNVKPIFISDWILERKFSNEESAVHHISSEQIWSIEQRRCYSTQSGRKVHYRCNRAKPNGSLCSVMKCLYFPKDSGEVWMYKTEAKHDHDKTFPAVHNSGLIRQTKNLRKKFNHPMNKFIKLRITKLYRLMKSPKKVMLQLESEGFDAKSRELQIRNYCGNLRRRQNLGKWIFEKCFRSVKQAKLYLKQQKIWNYKFQNRSQHSLTYHYRCKLGPKSGLQCAARKYINYNTYSNEVTLYQLNSAHTHDILNSSSSEIEKETTWFLNYLPISTRKTLKEQGFKVLDAVGLRDCLAEPTDSRKSIHEKLCILQQPSDSNFDSETPNKQQTPVEVDLLEGNKKNNEVINISQKRNKKPGYTLDWKFEQKFPNEQKALKFLAKEKIWQRDNRKVYSVARGRKVHYHCNQLQIDGSLCAAWKCLLYSVDSNEVTLYRRNAEHTHGTVKNQQLKEHRPIDIINTTSACESVAPKRGRPRKYPSNTDTKDENINDKIKNSEPNIIKEIPVTSMEFVTGDDSFQYIINYIDDDQISKSNDKAETSLSTDTASEYNEQMNAAITLPIQQQNYIQQLNPPEGAVLLVNSDQIYGPMYHVASVTTTPIMNMDIDNYFDYPIDKNKSWRLEEKIPNMSMVSSYLNKQNMWRCKHRSSKSFKVLFNCIIEKCEAEMYLIHDISTNEVLVYRNREHTHHNDCETNNLPLYFNGTECVPANLNTIMKEELIIVDVPMVSTENTLCTSNSNTITKEELIIVDVPMATTENLCTSNFNIVPNEEVIFSNISMAASQSINDAIDMNTRLSDKQQMISVTKWNFERKFANINEANNFILELDGKWEIELATSRKLLYRCMYPCKPACPAYIFFALQPNCDEVIYFSGVDHDHRGEETIMPTTLPSTEHVVILVSDMKDTTSDLSPVENSSLNNSENAAPPPLGEFVFKGKFANRDEAIKKMSQETDHWVLTCNRQQKNEYRQYYWCNYSNETKICTCRVFLLGTPDSDEVLYYSTNSHIHDVNLCEDETTTISKPIEPTQTCIEDTNIFDESDMDSLNGDNVETYQEEWIFETKFDDYKTAKHYMKNLNLSNFKSNISKSGVIEYFNCNLVASETGHCPASKYLLYKDINSDVLMYNRNIQHIIACTNIIPPLVPTEKRSINVIDLVDSDESEIDDTPKEEHTTLSLQQKISINFKKIWTLEKTFKTSHEAKMYLNNQTIWIFDYKCSTANGTKEYYRCNLPVKPEPDCMVYKFLNINESDTTCLYKTNHHKHSHTYRTAAATANKIFKTLSVETKSKIQELFLAGNTTHQVIEHLELDNRIYSCIDKKQQQVNKKVENPVISPSITNAIKTIEHWLLQMTAIPECKEKLYCVNYQVDYSQNKFQCFMSTQRLLKNAADSNSVHVDTESVLNFQQNSIIMVGTTDFNQIFHLLGIAICSNEFEYDYQFIFNSIRKGVVECYNRYFKPKCLMVDDNNAISHAFIKTFSVSSKIGTYSNVALSKIFSKLPACDEGLQIKIKEDILKLHKLSSQNLFFKAAKLFLLKWRTLGDKKLIEFLNYFKANWINKNANWFQGFHYFSPHTNHIIRTEFESLKNQLTPTDNDTTVETFLAHIKTEIENLSKQYSNQRGRETKQFARKPTIPISVYEKAVDWKNLEKRIEIEHHNNEVCYYFAAGDEKFIDENLLQKYRECNHQSFDEFMNIQSSFWCVRRFKNSIILSCNCVFFLENFVCKHSVGMSTVLNIIKFPPSIKFVNWKRNPEIVNYINYST